MTIPDILSTVAVLYLFVGSVFGLAFVTVGVTKVDPAARGTSPAFRALILPGSTALWPLLAVKWLRRSRRPA